MSAFAIGVDLGGTNLRIAAVQDDGSLLEKVTIGARVNHGPETVLDDICSTVRQFIAKYSRSYRLLGTGVGVPGIIEMSTGTLRESPNLPGWSDYPVREALEQRLECPVILENDANAAALGESWLGAARNVESMLILTLGTGVGGGIVLKGRIWHGMNGMAGEMGHTIVHPEGPRCGCGNRGCVEQYASATAIMRMAREKIENGSAPGLARAASSRDVEFSAKGIYNLAVQGEPAAREILRTAGWALGILLSNMVNALNLNMYVLGGGVSAAWDMFSPAMLEELRDRSLVYAATMPAGGGSSEGASSKVKALPLDKYTVVTRAVLGSDAGLYGAARLPMMATEQREHAHTPST